MQQSYQSDFDYSQLPEIDSYLPSYLGLPRYPGLPPLFDSFGALPDKDRNEFLEPELSNQSEIRHLDQKQTPPSNLTSSFEMQAREKECNFDVESDSTIKKQNSRFLNQTNNQHDDMLKNKPKKKKGDQMRNLYPGLMKTTVNALLNPKYKKKLKKIWRSITRNNLFIEEQELVDYFEKMKDLNYSLKDIYYFMNFREGNEKEKALKEIFHDFMVWFTDREYTLSVLTSDQCEHKNLYLRGKNMLRYLPDLNQKKIQPSTKICPCKNSRTI